MRAFVLIFVFATLSYSLSDNQPTTYTNPVHAEDFADPAVLRVDSMFYAIGTGGRVMKSPDLVDWTKLDPVFERSQRPKWWGKRGFWAADLRLIEGKFYCYYANARWKGKQNAVGLFVAQGIEGPWKDMGPIITHNANPGINMIDPFVLQENDSLFLYYGTYRGGIWMVNLTPDGYEATGQHTQVLPAHRLEGTWVHRRNSFYYLFGSTGTCCSGCKSSYRVIVGRSKSRTGPFVDKKERDMAEQDAGTVVLAEANGWKGPGHHSMAGDAIGNDWIVYHAHDCRDPNTRRRGRILLIDKMEWDKDGWPVPMGPSNTPKQRPVN